MSKIWLWLAKKLALNALSKWFKSRFSKKDYREIYKPISEASYLNQKCEYKKPKYSKLKQLVISLIIYAFMMSLAYNILLIRECAELKENLEFILEQAQKLNEENQAMIDSLAKTKSNQHLKDNFKTMKIKKEGGKYVEKYSIEPK